MNDAELIKVAVYPDGENYVFPPPSYKSDDYVVRESTHCDECGELLDLEYDSPFAHCACGTTEWYK